MGWEGYGPFLVGYLTMLSISRLYIASDERMIIEYGDAGGMRIGRGKAMYREKPCLSATIWKVVVVI
jgi:hypothetical protein